MSFCIENDCKKILTSKFRRCPDCLERFRNRAKAKKTSTMKVEKKVQNSEISRYILECNGATYTRETELVRSESYINTQAFTLAMEEFQTFQLTMYQRMVNIPMFQQGTLKLSKSRLFYSFLDEPFKKSLSLLNNQLGTFCQSLRQERGPRVDVHLQHLFRDVIRFSKRCFSYHQKSQQKSQDLSEHSLTIEMKFLIANRSPAYICKEYARWYNAKKDRVTAKLGPRFTKERFNEAMDYWLCPQELVAIQKKKSPKPQGQPLNKRSMTFGLSMRDVENFLVQEGTLHPHKIKSQFQVVFDFQEGQFTTLTEIAATIYIVVYVRRHLKFPDDLCQVSAQIVDFALSTKAGPQCQLILGLGCCQEWCETSEEEENADVPWFQVHFHGFGTFWLPGYLLKQLPCYQQQLISQMNDVMKTQITEDLQGSEFEPKTLIAMQNNQEPLLIPNRLILHHPSFEKVKKHQQIH